VTVTTRRTGETLLACWSGATDPTGRAALGTLVSAVRRDAPSVDVRDIAANLIRPGSSASSFASPVRVAVPLTLTDGTDVALALEAARRADPTIRIAPALGPDWTLAEICVQRLIEAGARKGDTIVLGVAGSDHDAAINGYSRSAQLLSAVWGGPVHVGSIGGRDTPLADAVDIARAHGQRVVVSAYLLTPGRDADLLRNCGADLVTAPLLDGGPPDQRLVSLVITRFHQAIDLGVRTS
jgi:hypothetical protein